MPDHPIEQLSINPGATSNDHLADALAGWLVNNNPSSQGGGDLALAELAQAAGACGAWAVAYGDPSPHPRLLSMFMRLGDRFEAVPQDETMQAWIESLNGNVSSMDTRALSIHPAGELHFQEISVSHLLHLPILEGGRRIGSVVLAFDHEPSLMPIHHDLFRLVSTTMAGAFQPLSGRRSREILTLQANLTGLIAKIIDPATDLNHLLSLVLEHTVLPLGASIGGIWLLNSAGDEFELSSSLLRLSRSKLPERVIPGQGLTGQVAQTCQTLLTDSPTQHPDFDPVQDAAWSDFSTLLVIPLCRHSNNFGVLVLCWDYREAVSDEELVIIENLADLASAFMANIMLINQLSGYSTQQHALLEMSRQVALGLDLETTIARGLQWVTRLVGTEFGLLWLIDHDQEVIRLQDCIGSGMKDVQDLSLPLDDESCRQWWALQKPVVVRDLAPELPFWLDYENLLGIQARDLIALPLESQGELIGVLLLINRVGGLTLESEPAMLATAADMIALALSNARLHTQTLELIDERERAHALALQANRMATVGRLTATLSHEINNPMQAIRGALSLAQEDLNDTESLQEYLSMCIHESDRVVDLIDKMRHVYLPQSDESGMVHLNETLLNIMVFAHKVSLRQGVEIQMELSPDLSPVEMASDQIHLVLLSLTLNLSDAVAAGGGDLLKIRTCAADGCVRVEFLTQTDLRSVSGLFDQPESQPLTESGIGLAFSQDIIRSLNGELRFAARGQDVLVTLDLPARVVEADQVETR